jgi:chemotaxis protein MotA
MDGLTLGGIVLAILAVVGSVFLDHGSLVALINPSAFLLVVGGTVGATVASGGQREVKSAARLIMKAIKKEDASHREAIELMVSFAQYARREGLLALDARLEGIQDPFLKAGVQAVVDGVDPEVVRELLQTELRHVMERHRRGAALLETAGGYAPTMGIIGTVVGLVHVLSNLANANAIGPAIAQAFTATLYGIASANILWLPLATKLKARSHDERLVKEIYLEGILSIQAGDNPRLVRSKLMTFLPPAERAEAPVQGGEASQQEAVG